MLPLLDEVDTVAFLIWLIPSASEPGGCNEDVMFAAAAAATLL